MTELPPDLAALDPYREAMRKESPWILYGPRVETEPAPLPEGESKPSEAPAANSLTPSESKRDKAENEALAIALRIVQSDGRNNFAFNGREKTQTMAKLISAQPMILQAILDSQGDSLGYIEDGRIAKTTGIALEDVRYWLETLEGEDLIQVARTEAGLSASINAKGRLALGQFRPFSTTMPDRPSAPRQSTSGLLPQRENSDSHSLPKVPPISGKVFISYCHSDQKALARLQKHLAPLEQQGLVESWDDTRIKPGARSLEEIEAALKLAKVAVLLVSADFLASSFITRKEIPEILKAEQSRGLVVLPVILSKCQVDASPLEPFQAVNPPSRLLTSMDRGEKEEVWDKVARAVREAVAGSDP